MLALCVYGYIITPHMSFAKSYKHSQHVRQLIVVVAGILAAIMPVVSVAAMPSPVGASGAYANALVADKALSYVGRSGGEACRVSRKPGDKGGQCRAFVNCIVWMTSGGTQNLGGRSYFQTFLSAGGTEIRSVDALQKGDIVQEGHGKHTFIIVSRVSGNTFNIVDSNRRRDERVRTYDRPVTLNSSKRAYRMGTPSLTPAVAAAAVVKPMKGALETVEASPGGITVKGWAIDADVTRPISAQIVAGKGVVQPEHGNSITLKADDSRLDIAAQNPGFGSSHGFRSFMELPEGDHTICLYGINAPNTPGENTNLGCKTVTVR